MDPFIKPILLFQENEVLEDIDREQLPSMLLDLLDRVQVVWIYLRVKGLISFCTER